VEKEYRMTSNHEYRRMGVMITQGVLLLGGFLITAGGALCADEESRNAVKLCVGPNRFIDDYIIESFLSDPYSAYRLAAWDGYDMNAESIQFWCFSDAGGGENNSWNPFSATHTSYSALFVDKTTVTAGKHMEAVREGVQDFEYLTLLRKRIETLEKAGAGRPGLAHARDLLAAAPRRVLDAPGARNTTWREHKDRTVADAVRIEIGEMLERLR